MRSGVISIGPIGGGNDNGGFDLEVALCRQNTIKRLTPPGRTPGNFYLREPGPGAGLPSPGPDLPSSYGQDRLIFLRDDTLFATWELSGANVSRYWHKAVFHLSLRGPTLRLLKGWGGPRFDAHGVIVAEHCVEGSHGNFHVPSQERRPRSAGRELVSRRFLSLASDPVPLPCGKESDVIDAEWMTIEEVLERSCRGRMPTAIREKLKPATT